jgi:hypothetical protein
MMLDHFRGGTICHLRAVRKRVSHPGEDDIKRPIRRTLPGEDDIGAFWQPQFLVEDDISEWPAAFAAPPRGSTSSERVWAQGARCKDEEPYRFPPGRAKCCSTLGTTPTRANRREPGGASRRNARPSTGATRFSPTRHSANAHADSWSKDLEKLPDPPPVDDLHRLIDHRVDTVRGPEKLWEVKGGEAQVVPDSDLSCWVALDPAELLLEGAA